MICGTLCGPLEIPGGQPLSTRTTLIITGLYKKRKGNKSIRIMFPSVLQLERLHLFSLLLIVVILSMYFKHRIRTIL